MGNSRGLTEHERALIRLVKRSPDEGEGWRAVSNALWPHVRRCATDAALFQLDMENRRIRLTEDGETVYHYLGATK